jgi:hypothetical protein
MHKLIAKDPRNASRIIPYIGGDEVNNDPRHAHHRYVIDLNDLSENEARELYPDLIAIVDAKVRPERAHDKRLSYRENWWRFAEKRVGLYNTVKSLSRILVISQITHHHAFSFVPSSMIYDQRLILFAFQEWSIFPILQARVHEIWARTFSSSLEDRLCYTPTTSFVTFPMAKNFEQNQTLSIRGSAYYEHRSALMIERNEGLTKAYNRFHDRRETSADIVRLRELHAEVDQAALRAYGWDDLAECAEPQFLDETNEDDHKYQGRLFWPGEFRDEVLARLLALNAERAAAERENEPLALGPRAKRATKSLAEAELLASLAADEDD